MNKTIKITVLAAFTLIGSATFGQSLNFSGGYTTSTLKGPDISESSTNETYGNTTYSSSMAIKNTSGFNASMGYEFKLGDRLSLETGLKYINRGYKVIGESSYQDPTYSSTSKSTVDYKMNYFDLPVVLNTAILTGDVRVYARTGIYAGLMTSIKYTEETEFSGTMGSGTQSAKERVSGSDIGDLSERIGGGFVLGVGAEYKNFFFEANYTLGTYSLEHLDEETYTHDLSLSVGYKLKFNKK